MEEKFTSISECESSGFCQDSTFMRLYFSLDRVTILFAGGGGRVVDLLVLSLVFTLVRNLL